MITRITVTPAVRPTSGDSFTVANLGRLGEVERFELSLPQFKRAIRGKVFLKGLLGLSGMEVSVMTLPAGAAIPFLHCHRAHEELYLFIGGRGQMQVDCETFDVEEGSVVRAATEGSIPDAEAADDGKRVDKPVVWP